MCIYYNNNHINTLLTNSETSHNNYHTEEKRAIGNKVIILLAVNELWAPACVHKQVSTADVCVWECVCVQRHTDRPHVRTWKQQIAIDVRIICISNIVRHTMFY